MAAASNEAVSTQGEGYHHISLMILFTEVDIQTSITVPLKNFGPLGCTYSTDHCMVKHVFVGILLWGTLLIRAYFMRSRIGKFSEQFSNQRNSARRTNITQMGAKTRKWRKTQIQHITENSSRKTWFSSRETRCQRSSFFGEKNIQALFFFIPDMDPPTLQQIGQNVYVARALKILNDRAVQKLGLCSSQNAKTEWVTIWECLHDSRSSLRRLK